jgi:hypothetical protein
MLARQREKDSGGSIVPLRTKDANFVGKEEPLLGGIRRVLASAS